MSKLFDIVSYGIGEIVEHACNNKYTSTSLSREAFSSLAYMSELMSPNMSLKEHEFAARCINITGLACQIMNTHESGFACSGTYLACRKFINDICDELGMEKTDYQRIYWLNRIDYKLPIYKSVECRTSKFFEIMSKGLQEIAEMACSSDHSTEISKHMFYAVALFCEEIKSGSVSLSDTELADVLVVLVGSSCRAMNTNQDNFKDTELYRLCKTYVTTLCNGMNASPHARELALCRLDDRLATE
ncbi:TPA: hypothetical protein ACVU5P_004250 [Vibrio parahaemolyticus]